MNAKATAEAMISNHGRFGALNRCEDQLAMSPDKEFWQAVLDYVSKAD